MAYQQNVPVRHTGLPNLHEILSRTTLAPVDLFSFYIYMRDQVRSVDYLDFWLDVAQHTSLCRHFVRELRRSVLLETPEMEKAQMTGSKRSSQILDNFDLHDNATAGSIHSERSQDQRVSAYLRDTGRDSSSQKHSQKESSSSGNSAPHTPFSGGNGDRSADQPRPSFMGSSFGQNGKDYSPAKDSTPQHTVSRADIRASAEKILYTYLLPGSERQINIPPDYLDFITAAIEEHDRDDPEVFDQAKDYVFAAMERDAVPGFLRAKALGNLVPPSLMLRLIIGLLAMFGAFWAAFILIFLDESRATRCWLILPFSIGVYALASHQYILDPILALAGYSEYTFFTFTAIREPFVRKLLSKRALIVSAWIIAITAALVCLFVFVPGKRL